MEKSFRATYGTDGADRYRVMDDLSDAFDWSRPDPDAAFIAAANAAADAAGYPKYASLQDAMEDEESGSVWATAYNAARTVIVTRHAGAVEWLAAHGITGQVIAQATAEDVRGRRVYGALPLHLAAEATEVWSIDMPGLTAEQRGKDLAAEEMDAAGATLRGYVVRRK